MTSVISGAGLALRSEQMLDLIADSAGHSECPVAWLEVLADNYLSAGGLHLERLHILKERFPVVLHSVGFNIGSADGVDPTFLKAVKKLADDLDPAWVSDHLAWIGIGHRRFPDRYMVLTIPRVSGPPPVMAGNFRSRWGSYPTR